MKFEVVRTSAKNNPYVNGDVPPCDRAVKEILLSAIAGTPEPAWTIEINTLQDLIEFGQQNGELILGASLFRDTDGVTKMSCIEIYDDHR